MEQNSTLFQKDGKYFLQLDCENAKELSLKWDDKTYSFVKDGEKWVLELPFSTAVNYVQICVDGQEVLHPDLPIGHGYGRLYNYIELPDEKKLAEIRDIPHGTLTHESISLRFPITGNDSSFTFTMRTIRRPSGSVSAAWIR